MATLALCQQVAATLYLHLSCNPAPQSHFLDTTHQTLKENLAELLTQASADTEAPLHKQLYKCAVWPLFVAAYAKIGWDVSDRGDDFVAAVQRLRHEPGLWERLSQQARAKMQTEYSNKVCTDRWDSFLWELHQDAGPRRQIKVPSQFNLPPVNPDLASLDPREPPLHIKILRKSRAFLNVSSFFHHMHEQSR